MKEFVLCNKTIKLSEELAKSIYDELSDSEKQNIDSIMHSQHFSLPYIIEALYFRLSNRKRMDSNFVTAIKKNKPKDIKIVEIKEDNFYIDIDYKTGKESIRYNSVSEYEEPESILKWQNNISYEDEVEKSNNNESINDLFEHTSEKKISINRVKNKIVRKILKIKSKDVRNMEKELKEKRSKK